MSRLNVQRAPIVDGRRSKRLAPPPPGVARCAECGGLASHGQPGNPLRRKDKSCPVKRRERLALGGPVDSSFKAEDPHVRAYYNALDDEAHSVRSEGAVSE